MSKKSLKESIRKSVVENILNEKWSDVIPQAASGIANMGRNIAGQYALGGIDKRFQRVGQRIEKDWKVSADEIASKANKLQGSKNQMIAKQAQQTLAKVDNISKQIDQAMKIMNAPADSSLKTGQQDPNDPFQKHQSEQDFEEWMRNGGARVENLSKAERGKYLQKWRQMKSLGLDPKNIPIEDMQREIAIAAHKQHLSLRDLDKRLRGSNPYGVGLGHEFGVPGEEDDENDGNEEEDGENEADMPENEPAQIARPRRPAQQAPAQVNGQNPPKGDIDDLMKKQQANRPPAPPSGAKPPPIPAAAQKRPMPPPGAPQSPSYDNAGIPALDKKNATQGNVGAAKAPPAAKPIEQPSAPGMQSPQRQKGQASPAPVSHPGAEQPKQQYQGLKIPQGTPSEPEPVPLTKLKPHNPPKQYMDMPPREIPNGKAVPSSIKGMLPPIKDDGQSIQVGTEDKPGMSPREDYLKGDKSGENKISPLNKLKLKAEKSKDPKDVESYQKALQKDASKKKPSKK